MSPGWPDVAYDRWHATCDTVHAHTQVLGKLAVALAPPEPQLAHAALRLTARGWETPLLPAPDGSGGLVVALDLRAHEAVVEHTRGGAVRIPLIPDRAVGEVTRDVLAAVARLGGAVTIRTDPQEVPWTVPLNEDDEHATYDPAQVDDYLVAATRAALVLARFRAPYRGRSTQVMAWWGAFDLAVTLFSGVAVRPPSDDFLVRNSADAQGVSVGWWPGDARHPTAAFYAYAHPAPAGFPDADLSPGRWDGVLGEYLLEWDDVRTADDPEGVVLDFARRVFRHACALCGWDETLAGSAEGRPPPLT
ncbi:MAG TPA: DUF5996 family protein [Blastococcus sp.]|nr:DUF5996 family protein [Blastococcus sp.]